MMTLSACRHLVVGLLGWLPRAIPQRATPTALGRMHGQVHPDLAPALSGVSTGSFPDESLDPLPMHRRAAPERTWESEFPLAPESVPSNVHFPSGSGDASDGMEEEDDAWQEDSVSGQDGDEPWMEEPTARDTSGGMDAEDAPWMAEAPLLETFPLDEQAERRLDSTPAEDDPADFELEAELDDVGPESQPWHPDWEDAGFPDDDPSSTRPSLWNVLRDRLGMAPRAQTVHPSDMVLETDPWERREPVWDDEMLTDDEPYPRTKGQQSELWSDDARAESSSGATRYARRVLRRQEGPPVSSGTDQAFPGHSGTGPRVASDQSGQETPIPPTVIRKQVPSLDDACFVADPVNPAAQRAMSHPKDRDAMSLTDDNRVPHRAAHVATPPFVTASDLPMEALPDMAPEADPMVSAVVHQLAVMAQPEPVACPNASWLSMPDGSGSCASPPSEAPPHASRSTHVSGSPRATPPVLPPAPPVLKNVETGTTPPVRPSHVMPQPEELEELEEPEETEEPDVTEGFLSVEEALAAMDQLELTPWEAADDVSPEDSGQAEADPLAGDWLAQAKRSIDPETVARIHQQMGNAARVTPPIPEPHAPRASVLPVVSPPPSVSSARVTSPAPMPIPPAIEDMPDDDDWEENAEDSEPDRQEYTPPEHQTWEDDVPEEDDWDKTAQAAAAWEENAVPVPPVPPVMGNQAEVVVMKPRTAAGPVAPTFTLPPLTLLRDHVDAHATPNMEQLRDRARLLEQKLADFRIQGQIVDMRPGPVVTTYDLDPAPGLKAAKVVGLSDDLARSILAQTVRVVGNIPGKSTIGIEVPNDQRQIVLLRHILESPVIKKMSSPLAVALGSDITGAPVVSDLAKMPHLLVAGTTGSGKSVAINAMICTILFRALPSEVRLLMVDPKMLELSIYEGIPHLMAPVVTDVRKAANLLKWAVSEMEERYRLMSEIGVRNLNGYNTRIQECLDTGDTLTRRVKTGLDPETGMQLYEVQPIPLEKKPLVVILIDELADLMIQVGKEVEPAIARLAQMARAAGIHLVLATQRPSVDVITGLIKSNFPTRLAFAVSSRIDSRTILDAMGAERLLGMGDGLYLPPGTSHVQRIHAPFVSDKEVRDLVSVLKAQGTPQYDPAILNDPAEGGASDGGGPMGAGGGTEGEYDELYDQSVAMVLKARKISTSMVQRHFKIGYNRAARIVEKMEEDGLISPPNHQGKREVLVPGSVI
jgi:S-DNA-T family DNA segregation ATPase FtsK/SpoIIIE